MTKIQIIKAPNKGFWYYHLIGIIVDVEDNQENNNWKVIGMAKENGGILGIRKSDTKVISYD